MWLTLHAPAIARGIRPGQYLLVRCADADSADPLLRRPLFVAAAEESLGQIGLLYAPSERGLRWLSRARPGEPIDALGPFGHGFEVDRRTRTLLLVGQGDALGALLLLASQSVRRGCAVALLAGAADQPLLPPAFLLPDEVEYQSTVGSPLGLLLPPAEPAPAKGKRRPEPPRPTARPELLAWADQVCAALPAEDAATLRDQVRLAKLRWERGFASALLDGPFVCGTGACGVCAAELRVGQRMRCSDGPVFDLRDL